MKQETPAPKEAASPPPQEQPEYRLLQPFFCGDVLFAADQIIRYSGVPNEAMLPLNEAARAKLKEFLSRLPGGKTPLLEDTVFRAMQDRPREESSSQVELARAPLKPPPMGTVQAVGARPAYEAPKQVEVVAPPEVPALKKAPVMGTVADER